MSSHRPDPSPPVVRAAGGVLWRHTADDVLEVVLVHRPRYNDWSLPKGKQDPGESDVDTALREVLEETGYTARITDVLPTLDYVLPGGQPKVVAWYAMEVTGGAFAPNDEVDELVWLPVPAATARLTRATDGILLTRLERLRPTPA
jgi:8-oxo-dGTP pyrophosphatase MutT (NUDIX family)